MDSEIGYQCECSEDNVVRDCKTHDAGRRPAPGEPQLAFIDGRDALAAVIVKPNDTGTGVLISSYANGITKPQAAMILRHVADQWDKEAVQRNAN